MISIEQCANCDLEWDVETEVEGEFPEQSVRLLDELVWEVRLIGARSFNEPDMFRLFSIYNRGGHKFFHYLITEQDFEQQAELLRSENEFFGKLSSIRRRDGVSVGGDTDTDAGIHELTLVTRTYNGLLGSNSFDRTTSYF